VTTAGESVVVFKTLRNRIWAGVPTWRMSWLFVPGTETMIVRSPSVTTVASATPNPLTRFSMMSRAVLRLSRVMFCPAPGLATRVSVVPPIRSRPSLGLRRLPNDPLPVTITSPNRTRKMAASVKRYRDGRIWP